MADEGVDEGVGFTIGEPHDQHDTNMKLFAHVIALRERVATLEQVAQLHSGLHRQIAETTRIGLKNQQRLIDLVGALRGELDGLTGDGAMPERGDAGPRDGTEDRPVLAILSNIEPLIRGLGGSPELASDVGLAVAGVLDGHRDELRIGWLGRSTTDTPR